MWELQSKPIHTGMITTDIHWWREITTTLTCLRLTPTEALHWRTASPGKETYLILLTYYQSLAFPCYMLIFLLPSIRLPFKPLEPLLASIYTLLIRVGAPMCVIHLCKSLCGVPSQCYFQQEYQSDWTWPVLLARALDKQVTWGTSMPGWELQSFWFSSCAAASTCS